MNVDGDNGGAAKKSGGEELAKVGRAVNWGMRGMGVRRVSSNLKSHSKSKTNFIDDSHPVSLNLRGCVPLILLSLTLLVSCKDKADETVDAYDPVTGRVKKFPTQQAVAEAFRAREKGMKPWRVVQAFDTLVHMDKDYKKAVETYVLPYQLDGVLAKKNAAYMNEVYGTSSPATQDFPLYQMMEQFFTNNTGTPTTPPYEFGMVTNDDPDDNIDSSVDTYTTSRQYVLCDVSSKLKELRREYEAGHSISEIKTALYEFYNIVPMSNNSRSCQERPQYIDGSTVFKKFHGEWYIDFYNSPILRRINPYAAYAAKVILSGKAPACWTKSQKCLFEDF